MQVTTAILGGNGDTCECVDGGEGVKSVAKIMDREREKKRKHFQGKRNGLYLRS